MAVLEVTLLLGDNVRLTVQLVSAFQSHYAVFMVALWNRADHYIFILWFLLPSSFFPRLISAVADWMSVILPHMMWP